MRTFHSFVASPVTALLLVAACATVPITGRTQLMLIDDDKIIGASAITFADFMRGAEQKRAVLSRAESLEASRILDQVNRVSTRIIEASRLKDKYNWEVVVVKSILVMLMCFQTAKS